MKNSDLFEKTDIRKRKLEIVLDLFLIQDFTMFVTATHYRLKIMLMINRVFWSRVNILFKYLHKTAGNDKCWIYIINLYFQRSLKQSLILNKLRISRKQGNETILKQELINVKWIFIKYKKYQKIIKKFIFNNWRIMWN